MALKVSKLAFRLGLSTMMGAYMMTLTPTPVAYSDTVSMTQDTINLNGAQFSTPYGFVDKGTTYMPLYYVIQLLKACGVPNSWNGRTGTWSINPTQSIAFSALNRDHVDQQIQINGQFFAGFYVLDAKEPSSSVETAFAPIYDIIQVLKSTGILNSWNGVERVWTVTSNGASTISQAPASTFGVYNKIQLQNGATDDSTYWSRADQDLYIWAQTYDPSGAIPSNPPKLLDLAVGQSIHLFAYSEDTNVKASQTSWQVNSSYATVVPDGTLWQSGSAKKLDEAHATFVASKPGIYTVQANVNGNYTVPLVITVGFNQLNRVDLTQPASQLGVQLFPQTNTDFSQSQDFGTDPTNSYTAALYQPVNNGWIPVAGIVPSTVQQVSILLEDSTSSSVYASYTVPTYTSTAGKQFFRAEVLSPLANGSMTVQIVPDFPQYLTQTINSLTPSFQPITLSYLMSGGASLSQNQLDVMPSAKMDYNMSPQFEQIASTLMENAPTVDAGIEAINNYVSNFITYDQTELQAGGYRFQDSLQTLATGSGICEDYAELTSSFLRSIGIPVETIQGIAQDPTGELPRDPSAENAHEWLKAWDGNQWMVMDPTWSSAGSSDGTVLVNEFFTLTNSFTVDHDATSSGIGTGF